MTNVGNTRPRNKKKLPNVGVAQPEKKPNVSIKKNDELVKAIRAYNEECESMWPDVGSFYRDRPFVAFSASGSIFYALGKPVWDTFKPVLQGLDKDALGDLKAAMGNTKIDDIPSHLRSQYILEGNEATYLRQQMINKGMSEDLVSKPVRWDNYLAGEIKSLDKEINALKTDYSDEPTRSREVSDRISKLEQKIKEKNAQKKLLDALSNEEKSRLPSVISVVDGGEIKSAVLAKGIVPAGVEVDNVAKAMEKLGLNKKIEEAYRSIQVHPETMKKSSSSNAIEVKRLKKTKAAGRVIKGSVSHFVREVLAHPIETLKKHKKGAGIILGGSLITGGVIHDYNNEISSAWNYVTNDETTKSGIIPISKAQFDALGRNYVAIGLTKEEYETFKENVNAQAKMDSDKYDEVNKKMQEAFPDGQAGVHKARKGLVDKLQAVSSDGQWNNKSRFDNSRMG